ncbi:beta galactosidase jelly roll domain-containing protein [Reichenbachiella carrageenanivorans]|uniref:Beta galactosidase jelly roll domain-containing protein n=1 Tax=Reichenbachiella carrageenanivorans TaxID=2979869 RepID=A0ABY6CVC6_9BACT|nr:glycoside hydrolase family 2 TIM barrel-domain containing protein [Reichenbachiella carrageenanivorans]UXX77867.1 beta galactosidase jelly roll domain-containing protein [Reichenbachiella carrageenanivorans]
MKKIHFIPYLLLGIFLASCQESKEPKEQSLNGTWQFVAAHSLSEEEVLSGGVHWDTLAVPGNWDTRERYTSYVGKGYYQRTFEISKKWSEKQIRLRFGAVYQQAKVWLNGQLLGQHVGGYTPFEFNITDQVNWNQPNTLTVMADNSYQRGAWLAWGGISRRVTLHADAPRRMVYQHISAIPDFENEKIRFAISYQIENNSTEDTQVQIQPRISSGTQPDPVKVTVLAGQSAQASVQWETGLLNYQLWDLDDPTLYELTSELTVAGQLEDVISHRFGIRRIEARGEQLLLNNRPLRANGLNRVHDHPAYGNTEPDHLVESDMSDIMALGGRFSRLMHAPLSENLLDLCDSLGFLLIEEIPVWGNDDPQSFASNPQTQQWLRELIQRDYNHPSVVGWSVGNELRDSIPDWGHKTLTPDQLAYVNSMLAYVGTLDSTRLKTYVSLTAYGSHTTMGNEPYELLDLICINSYGDAQKAVRQTHEHFPGKPIFMSEIGRTQIGTAPDGALSEALITDLEALKELPYLVGVSIWSYNDYRSRYPGTPASGFREWGVVDERRNKKKAYRQLKEVYGKWNKNKKYSDEIK